MKFIRSARFSAFTLIELLVVIGIIAVIAGLVVGLNNVASEKKKISRAQVERDRLVTLIEAYKLKIGVYPPQNPNPNNLSKNTLLYELAGAFRDPASPQDDPNYKTPFGDIKSNVLYREFGVRGLVNASDDATEVKRFLKSLKPDQVASFAPGTLSLVVPIEGPDGTITPWKYLFDTNALGNNVLHNNEGFDLWVDIKTRGQTRTIGNWKD